MFIGIPFTRGGIAVSSVVRTVDGGADEKERNREWGKRN